MNALNEWGEGNSIVSVISLQILTTSTVVTVYVRDLLDIRTPLLDIQTRILTQTCRRLGTQRSIW